MKNVGHKIQHYTEVMLKQELCTHTHAHTHKRRLGGQHQKITAVIFQWDYFLVVPTFQLKILKQNDTPPKLWNVS